MPVNLLTDTKTSSVPALATQIQGHSFCHRACIISVVGWPRGGLLHSRLGSTNISPTYMHVFVQKSKRAHI